MKIEYDRNAKKFIETLEISARQRIRHAIEKIPQGDIVKLKGRKNEYRLRVGKYRVIFAYGDDIMCIYDVGLRGQIYRKGKRW